MRELVLSKYAKKESIKQIGESLNITIRTIE